MDAIEIRVAAGNFIPGGGVVTAEHFGGIQTGYSGARAFSAQFESLGFSHLRWPGGTLAETKPEVYGLDVPGIFDGTQLFNPNPDRERPDLAETLAYCVENDLSFSMIVPTLRYADDIARGVADLRAFLGDLLSGGGDYRALPERFTLEIGNEYVHHDVFAENPALYGRVADAFIGVIAEALASPSVNVIGADLSIAVQMGYSDSDDRLIRAELSPDSLQQIDALVAHALPLNFDAVDRIQKGADVDPEDRGETRWESRKDYFSAWTEAIAEAGGAASDVALYMSAMNMGSAATDPAAVNLAYEDLGLKAAGAYLELFATYLSIGMDSAAFWGVAVGNLNALTGTGVNGVIEKPAGELLRLMAENVVGMQLVDGFQTNTRDAPVMSYAFDGAEATVIFIAANDIADSGQEVRVDLGQFEGMDRIEAVRLGAILSPDAPSGVTGLDRMLYEVAVVEAFDPSVRNGTATFTLEQDYEVVMLRVAKDAVAAPADSPSHSVMARSELRVAGADAPEGSTAAEKRRGGAEDDRLLGAAGNDILWGKGGDDVLIGGEGKDRILGGPGRDDVLGGGNGDRLYGRAGADRIWGDAGNDRINGGTGDDRLFGGNGKDRVQGAKGNDWLEGGAGKDVLRGGSDDDRLFGNDGDDLLFGNRGKDVLQGGTGNDRLKGGPGKDWLEGGAGNDRLKGGAGQDRLYGGEDRDVLSGGTGNDALYGDAGSDQIRGGKGRDWLFGGEGKDRLCGGKDGDWLKGDADDDRLLGGAGKDWIYGGTGSDRLKGGPGKDWLDGGAGDDLLRGGTGADVFAFSGAAFGTDRIFDFEPGLDRLDLTGIDPWTFDADTLLGDAVQADGALVIDTGSGTIILAGLAASDLTADDFLL